MLSSNGILLNVFAWIVVLVAMAACIVQKDWKQAVQFLAMLVLLVNSAAMFYRK